MPFTPFHLGPGLAFGLPLKRYLYAPTFILGNLIVDVEGFLVLVLGLSYPLHGYLHTLLLACVVGLILGFVMFKLEKPMQPIYRKIQLETDRPLPLKSFLAAGVSGAILHVFFDAFLYPEMEPFFPLTINPLLDVPVSMSGVYLLCVGLGIVGILFYAVSFAVSMHKTSSSPFQS